MTNAVATNASTNAATNAAPRGTQRGRLWMTALLSLMGVLLPLALAAATMAPPAAPVDAAPVVDEWRIERDHWYRFTLDDQPCGWMRNQRLVSAGGAIQRTTSESVVRFGRAGQSVEIMVRSQFDETTRNEPRAAELRQQAGKEPVEQRYTFDEADRTRISVSSMQGGRRVESTITLPSAEWLTPIAAERFAASRRGARAATFSLRTVDLTSGVKISERTFTKQGDGRFDHEGREVPTTRWLVADSLAPLETIEEWSSDDLLLRTSTTLPMGKLEAALADRATALAALHGPSVELMVQTLIRTDRPIARPNETTRARLRVRAINGEIPQWPSIGAQRVTRTGASTLDVEVDASNTSPVSDEEQADERFRAPSVTIDSNDEAIRALARTSVRSMADASELDRANALRKAVYRHIRRKDMASAFATASETVRSREGDCTEHAVLLAAMLRAEGIPSRVVTGLVYCAEFGGSRDVFGWHMWTQAMIDAAWVDLDATLPGPARFHAAHLAIGASAHDEGALDAEWAALVPLLGNLSIEVVEVGHRDPAHAR